MADIQPPKQDDSNEETLIPMPSVTAQTQSNDPAKSQAKVQPSPSKVVSAAESVQSKKDNMNNSSNDQAASDQSTPGIKPTTSSSSSSDLDEIKNKALAELKPLIDEIDLPADQKFHTILEIISASNDKDMIPKLYEAAKAIEDEHERAKALIDVVSEIEYLSGEES